MHRDCVTLGCCSTILSHTTYINCWNVRYRRRNSSHSLPPVTNIMWKSLCCTEYSVLRRAWLFRSNNELQHYVWTCVIIRSVKLIWLVGSIPFSIVGFSAFFFFFSFSFFSSQGPGKKKPNPLIGESRLRCQSETVCCSSLLPVRNLGAQARSRLG